MIYRSPYPDAPVPPVSLPELVLGRARERGSHPALIDGRTGAVTTYGELAAAVDGLAAGLHEIGFRRGEVAAADPGKACEARLGEAFLDAGGANDLTEHGSNLYVTLCRANKQAFLDTSRYQSSGCGRCRQRIVW